MSISGARRFGLLIAVILVSLSGLLRPIPAAASPTGTLFALVGPSYTIARVDPATGSLSTIADLSLPPGQPAPSFGNMAIDPGTHRLYVPRTVAADLSFSSISYELITVDTQAGGIIHISPNMGQGIVDLVFDTSSGALYGHTNECCPFHLVRIDPFSGVLTNVVDLPGIQQGYMAIAPSTHSIYMTNQSFAPGQLQPINTILTVELTGPAGPTVFESPAMDTGVFALLYDTSSGVLFGKSFCCPAHLVSVNPTTGAAAPVGTFDMGYTSGLTIDSSSQTIFAAVVNQGAFGITTDIVSINDQTGAAVVDSTIPSGPNLFALAFDPLGTAPTDTSPPVTSSTLTPASNAAGWNNTNVTVNLSSTDPDGVADLATVHYSATGAQPIAATVVAGSSASFTVSAEGVTTITYFAKDQAGNTETAHILFVRIDKSPPVTSIALSPAPNGAGLNNTNVTVNLSVTDPDGFAEAATVHYSATGAQTIAPTVVAGSSASFTVTADGGTTITYFAEDQAGNTEAPHTLVLRIDRTPPVSSIALSPAPNAAGWNNTNVTVNLSATDPDGTADVATVHYSATGAQPIAATFAAGSSASFTLTAEGVTTITYFAKDQAGNTETPHAQVVRIDKTLPTVTYAGNTGTYTVDQTVAITCTAVDPTNANGTPGSGLASSTCVNANAPAYSFSLGPNTLSASATDNAGNVRNGSTTFTVQVTYSSLCNLTKRFIESSPAFQTSPAQGRAQEVRLCQLLTTAGSANGPAKKALIQSYQKGLALPVNLGFLTPAQAAILLTLSKAL